MSFLDSILGRTSGKEEKLAPFLPKDIYEAAKLDFADIIAPSALKITPREMNLGDKLVRTFYVISYPRFLSDGWFSPIINLDKVFDISIFVHPVDTGAILRKFQKKVAEIQSQVMTREEKGLVRDPILDTAYRDIEDLRDKLQQAQERIFDVGLYMSIYGENGEELDKAESEIRSILDAKLVYVKPALFQQEQGFKSVIPTGKDVLEINSKFNSSPLSSFFPFMSFDLTSDKGILYGVNRHNSSLVLFDRFSLENYNSVVFAKSGSGKSVKGSEPVLIREHGSVRLAKIGPVIEKIIRERGAQKIDDELEGVVHPGLEVFSFNKDLKGEWSPVSVAARKAAPDHFYTFKTKSGRAITTTADHNMLVLRGGRVVAAKSADVTEGEYVPLPRRVTFSEHPITHINLIDVLKDNERVYIAGAETLIKRHRALLAASPLDDRFDRYLYRYAAGRRVPIAYFRLLVERAGVTSEAVVDSVRIVSKSGSGNLPARFGITDAFGTLLGYISSEGTATKNVVYISNTDPETLADIKRAFCELGVPFYCVPGAVACAQVPFVATIHALKAGGYSGEKQVPYILFEATQSVIATYLRAYFEGDGGVDGAAITALSKSSELISGMSYLLFGFGIIARVHERWKTYAATGRKRKFHILSVSGASMRTFQGEIGFVSERKKRLLDEIARKPTGTNVDTIPGLQPLAEELAALFGSQVSDIPEFSALKQGHNFSPLRLARLAENIQSRVQRFRELYSFMQKLSDLPTIEAIVAKSGADRQLNQKLIEAMSSSWFTVKQGMPPRIQNALKIFEAAEVDAPETTEELKTMVTVGLSHMRVPANTISPILSGSLRGERDNSSYELLRTAATFIAGEYERVLGNLPRVEEIIGIFRTLGKADLFWDPIVAIEKSPNKNERFVYDLTVDNEVFLAGHNGMFVHNSYAMKLEILRSLMFDTEVIVIDPESEYEYLANAVGGRFFNISLSSDHHINPFDLPTPREDEAPSDVLRSNIINLVGLFRIMLGGLSPEEDAIIDRAITETYALKDITGERDFGSMEPPLLSDFEMVLAGMEGSESLVQRVTKYTKGTWSGFINRPTNVDINKKFVAFSVRNMEDELKPVAMYIITHFIWNAIRKELKKRLLVIDEAWWMMKSDDTASFLYSMAKRGRKYYLGLATITQDVEDFLKSPYGLPMLTNSSIQLLLKQSPTSIDVVQKTFNLTDEEKYLLLESDVGEGIFFAGLKHVAIKTIASYTEDQIITSDPSQLLAIAKAKKDEIA